MALTRIARPCVIVLSLLLLVACAASPPTAAPAYTPSPDLSKLTQPPAETSRPPGENTSASATVTPSLQSPVVVSEKPSPTTVAAAGIATPSEKQVGIRQRGWEYRAVDGASMTSGDWAKGVEDLLNPLGAEGWEATASQGQLWLLKRTTGSPRWEYRVIDGAAMTSGDWFKGTEDLLNPLGQEGWEATASMAQLWLLKRTTGGPRWEYRAVDGAAMTSGDWFKGTEDLLNPLGAEGWEAAASQAQLWLLKRTTGSPRWEYRAVDGASMTSDDWFKGTEDLLNPLGQEGWEAAASQAQLWLLKRTTGSPRWEYRGLTGRL